MIDIRYMALALISTFLALAIGLMTGSALGSPDKRDAVYENLRGEFQLLRDEISRVREESDVVRRRLDASQRATRELLPLAVRGRLPGSAIGIIICGNLDERPFWTELEAALTAAGATVGPVVRIPDRLRALSPEDRQRLAATWGDASASAPDSEADPHEAAGWIARAMVSDGTAERLDEIAKALGMQRRGDAAAPVKRVLVLIGTSDEARGLAVGTGDVPEARVVEAARAAGARVVAAEPQDTVVSAVERLRRPDVATVDNIDTAAGQISAVLALAGADGHFGSQPNATRPIPPLEAP